MNTIKDLLKETSSLPETTKVTLQLHLPLGKVRVNAKLLASFGLIKAMLERGKAAATKKIAPKSATAIETKQPTVKATPKAILKSSPKAVKAKKAKGSQKSTKKNVDKADPTVKEGNSARVTQATVLAALNAQHHTTQAIADAINASPLQVSKALSRYTQQGLIERTKPGQYALKQ